MAASLGWLKIQPNHCQPFTPAPNGRRPPESSAIWNQCNVIFLSSTGLDKEVNFDPEIGWDLLSRPKFDPF